jgi:serine/threonine-protein kinase RsbW
LAVTTVEAASRTREEKLTLRSEIAELALVPPWIERLASEYGIPGETQFAMNLCLEEVLSNIILHGYGNEPDRSIVVRYAVAEDRSSTLIVDDEAPHFNPLTADPLPLEDTLQGTRVGGLGIRLLRSFANCIRYEPTPAGNRLSMVFSK